MTPFGWSDLFIWKIILARLRLRARNLYIYKNRYTVRCKADCIRGNLAQISYPIPEQGKRRRRFAKSLVLYGKERKRGN